MAKRFIDTGLFDDDWFMDLSKDAKLLWIYLITRCDHAGILKLNEKLCKVQTDIKDLNITIKQLGNRLVTVKEHLYFIPKYIEFQYPGFPNSRVRQQISAVDILIKYGLFDKEKLTLNEELINTYENDNDNDTDNGNDKKGGMGGKFKKPSVDEIKAYCQERKNGIDAQDFFDHYEARGWIPKGYTTQMKDWQAAVRTWEKNKYKFNNNGANKPTNSRGVKDVNKAWGR